MERELPHRNEHGARTEWFFVARRDVGWIAGSLSITATQLSAATLVGAIGIHYLFGVSFILVWIGIWLGWLVSLFYIAPQLRRFGGVTVPEFLGARFTGDGADGARIQALAAVLVAVIYLVFTAAQYIAGGILIETILDLPAIYGMVGIMGLTLAYTTVGGMRASIVTDVILALALIVGLIVATWSSVSEVGGLFTLYAEVHGASPAHLGFAMPVEELLSFGLAFGLSLAVGPYQISRVYAMENEETVKASILVAIGIQTVIAVCILLLGLIAVIAFPGLQDPDAAIAELILSLLGPIAAVLLLIGVIAAILSTIDSVLLVSASAIAYDLYAEVLREDLGSADDPVTGEADERTLWVARLATVAAAVLPLGLALSPGLLGELVQVIAALFGALVAGALFAPVILGIHWGNATTRGAAAGILSGFVTVILWHLLWTVYDVVPGILEFVPPTAAGVLANAAVMIAVSLRYD